MLKEGPGGVRIRVFVQPNGRKSELLGEHDDGRGPALKIRIQAPPVEGKANEAIEEFLAKLFGISRRNARIVRGEQSRSKVIELSGVDLKTADAILRRALGAS